MALVICFSFLFASDLLFLSLSILSCLLLLHGCDVFETRSYFLHLLCYAMRLCMPFFFRRNALFCVFVCQHICKTSLFSNKNSCVEVEIHFRIITISANLRRMHARNDTLSGQRANNSFWLAAFFYDWNLNCVYF